jgi:hypothetical protein
MLPQAARPSLIILEQGTELTPAPQKKSRDRFFTPAKLLGDLFDGSPQKISLHDDIALVIRQLIDGGGNP